MNMQSLMAQAKKLQNDNKVTKIEVLNEEVLTEKELFEDMLLLAINDALDKIKKEKEERLGKYTNGLGGLF